VIFVSPNLHFLLTKTPAEPLEIITDGGDAFRTQSVDLANPPDVKDYFLMAQVMTRLTHVESLLGSQTPTSPMSNVNSDTGLTDKLR
jgi:hypothetical protein